MKGNEPFMKIIWPNILSIDDLIGGNSIRQILTRTPAAEGVLSPFTRGKLRGHFLLSDSGTDDTLIVPKAKNVPVAHSRVIEATLPAITGDLDLSGAIWHRHPAQQLQVGSVAECSRINTGVLDSWTNAFSFIKEDPAR